MSETRRLEHRANIVWCCTFMASFDEDRSMPTQPITPEMERTAVLRANQARAAFKRAHCHLYD